ncbi:hypothetical protein FQA47_020152 [Oryzias melastigma]|uniref:Uncharacterized protein n=1 Tax=Oryzias melastigma TaxID=30732 RepID=A0A834L2X6_ORYME|nr:hypothetical protein FQA47_020152 [Oryzias melastigma]
MFLVSFRAEAARFIFAWIGVKELKENIINVKGDFLIWIQTLGKTENRENLKSLKLMKQNKQRSIWNFPHTVNAAWCHSDGGWSYDLFAEDSNIISAEAPEWAKGCVYLFYLDR